MTSPRPINHHQGPGKSYRNVHSLTKPTAECNSTVRHSGRVESVTGCLESSSPAAPLGPRRPALPSPCPLASRTHSPRCSLTEVLCLSFVSTMLRDRPLITLRSFRQLLISSSSPMLGLVTLTEPSLLAFYLLGLITLFKIEGWAQVTIKNRYINTARKLNTFSNRTIFVPNSAI